jgi:hypothetical protein
VRYDVYVHESLLHAAPKSGAERRQVMEFIRWLGDHPFASGDYSDIDSAGRRREVAVVGRYAITFWADHAVREVKVTDLQVADS